MTQRYKSSADYVPENPEARALQLAETGIKGVEWVAELARMRHETIMIDCDPTIECPPGTVDHKVSVRRYANLDPIALIEKLLIEGKVIELEYVVPNMRYRIKSMYFPATTQMALVKGVKGNRHRTNILS